MGATHGTTTIDGIASTARVVVGMVVTSGLVTGLSGPDFAPLTHVATVGPTSLTLDQPALTTTPTLSFLASSVGVTATSTSWATFNLQTWDPSNYVVEAPSGDRCRKGRLGLGWSRIWPIIRYQMNAVTIRMPCGYGSTAASVPAILRQGMLLDAGTLYEVRGSVLTGGRAAAIEIPGTSIDIYRSYKAW